MATLCANPAVLSPNAAREPHKIKVGIYPAAFDPVHEGHLAFAKAAQNKYQLDKIFFLPEPNPNHKQGVKALEHRSNMVRLATANEKSFGLLLLESQDFDIRHVWPRITSRFVGSELFMLIGNNPVKRLGNWPQASEFGKQPPTFIIASRNKPVIEIDDSIQLLLKTKKFDLPYQVLEASYPELSAADIRRAIKAGSRPESVPYQVFEYIQRNKLYHK